MNVAAEDASDELYVLERQREKIVTTYGARFLRLCEYESIFAETEQEGALALSSDKSGINEHSVRMSDKEKGIDPAISGIVGGLAVGATATGLTVMLGTAGTGTAIGTLHGAAAVNATLAALGGGTLAAGGGGMVAGMMVLGGLIFIPGAAIGAFVWDKKVRKEHEAALEYAREAAEERERILAIRDKYKWCADTVRLVQYETVSLDGFLDGILDLFEAEIMNGDTGQAKKLCMAAMRVGERLLLLRVSSENGELNTRAWDELRAIRDDMDKIKHAIGEYMAGLSEQTRCEVREQMQKAMRRNAENASRGKEKKIITKGLCNEELREVFDQTFEWAKRQICIMSPWISNKVVDAILMDKMRRSMARGVKINIVYGIGDGDNRHKGKGDKKKNDDRNIKTEDMAKRLRKEFAAYGDLFIMRRSNTHGKLLICDNRYYVIGSFNFLSFAGDYSGDDKRDEIGDYSENGDMLAFHLKKWFTQE